MPEDQAEPVYLYDEDLAKCRDFGKNIATQTLTIAYKKPKELEIHELREQLTAIQKQLERLTGRLDSFEKD